MEQNHAFHINLYNEIYGWFSRVLILPFIYEKIIDKMGA